MLGLCKMNHADNVDRDHNNSNKTENTTMIMTTMVMMMITAVMMQTDCRFDPQASGRDSAYWDKCAKGKKQPTYYAFQSGSSAVHNGSQPTIVVKAHAPGNGCYMVVFNNGC